MAHNVWNKNKKVKQSLDNTTVFTTEEEKKHTEHALTFIQKSGVSKEQNENPCSMYVRYGSCYTWTELHQT